MRTKLKHQLIGGCALAAIGAGGLWGANLAFGKIDSRPDLSPAASAPTEPDAQKICRFNSRENAYSCETVGEYLARLQKDKQQSAQSKTATRPPVEQPQVAKSAPAFPVVPAGLSESPLPRSDAQSAFSFSPADRLAPDRNGMRYFVTGNRSFAVTPDVYKAFQESGLPVNGLLATAARESGLNAKAVNPDSGACGLFQFMTNATGTLYEAVFNYGARNGYGQYVSLVDQTVTKNGRVFYAPKDANARATLTELCKDALFNTRMHAEYTTPKVREYEAFLGHRKITTGEFILMNNIGIGGLKKFFAQAVHDKNTGTDMTAWDAFAKQGFNMSKFKANRSLLYDTDGKLLTVRESYARVFAEHGGGWGALRAQQADNSLSPSIAAPSVAASDMTISAANAALRIK